MVKVLAVTAMMALAACQTTGGSFCDISKPIRLTEATIDALSDAEVEEALAHNLKGQALCKWKT